MKRLLKIGLATCGGLLLAGTGYLAFKPALPPTRKPEAAEPEAPVARVKTVALERVHRQDHPRLRQRDPRPRRPDHNFRAF